MTEALDLLKLSVTLYCGEFCVLPTGDDFLIHVSCFMSGPAPFTSNTRNSIVDPSAAFAQGRIRVVNCITGEALQFPKLQDQHDTHVDKEAFAVHSNRLNLQSLNCRWTTNPSKANSTDVHFLDLKSAGIKANRRYKVTYDNHGLTAWFRGHGPRDDEAAAVGRDPEQMTVSVQGRAIFHTGHTLPPPPPLLPVLRTSNPELDLSGAPEFTAFIDWTLVGTRKVCMLFNLECKRCMCIRVRRDGYKKGRQVAPRSDQCFDERDDGDPISEEETPEFRYGLSDPTLIRLGPGGVARLSYTFTTETRQRGRTYPDTYYLVSGDAYGMNLRRPRHCRWMFEDELPGTRPARRSSQGALATVTPNYSHVRLRGKGVSSGRASKSSRRKGLCTHELRIRPCKRRGFLWQVFELFSNVG